MKASLVASLWLLLAAPARAAFEDSFPYPDRLLTNANPSSTRSAKWLVTRGSLFASGGQGWTGVPDAATPDATSSNGTGSSVFRALAQSPGGREATARVAVAGFLAAGAGNWDGAHIYARWLDQSNYYQFSVRRRDGRAAIKKRRNGTESTFTTPLYAVPPLGAAQSARVLLTDNSTGTVTLQLFINGALVAQAVDASNPIAGGRFGMAGENTEFRFDDFVVDGSTAAPPPAPSGPTVVSLTFDDGSADHMLAMRLLGERGMKGTFYVNSGRIGESAFYLTRAQLEQIAAAGHEIGGHSLTHPDLTTLSAVQLQAELCGDRTQLQSWGFSPVSFAYPFGADNAAVRDAARACGYTSARDVGGLSCAGCPQAETLPPAGAFSVRTHESVEAATTLADLQARVTRAEDAGGGWVPLVMHRICAGCDTYSMTQATLTSFLDWLAARSARGTVVRTVAQVMGAAAPPPPPPPPPAASTGSFFDGFAYADGLLTNSNPSSPRSSLWQATSGSLFASGGQGWTGVPDAVSPDATSSNGTGSSVFRVLARSAGGGEAGARVAVAGFRGGVSSWDGAHVYARWQDQSNYYQFTVRRRDGRAGIRKRRNGTVSTLASRSYAAPALGTPQAARVLLTDNADGSVTLRLFLDGALLAQAVDASSPFTGGRFGMAGENVEFRFDDFSIGGATAPVVSSAPAPSPGPLPRTVVSLTFDDTYADHLLASRMLDARGLKGTFYMNSPRFGSSSLYLTLAQARDIAARGHEVGGHTLGHVDLAAASTTEARRQVCDDRAALRSLGFPAASFAYPFGAFDAEAETIARDCGYASARSLGGTSETLPPADRYAVRAPWSVRDTTTLADLQRLVTDAEASGRWVTLVFHRVCDGCGNAYGVTPALLGSFLDWLRARPATTGVRTVGEVIAASYPAGTLAALSAAPAGAPAAAADPAFAFRDLYAFPNPSLRGARVTIRLQAGLADEVDVDFYDASGRRLHSGRFPAAALVDDGNGKGPQYTYDYPWDVGGVGSGVYLYSVSARKAGEPGIRKTGKAAVIK